MFGIKFREITLARQSMSYLYFCNRIKFFVLKVEQSWLIELETMIEVNFLRVHCTNPTALRKICLLQQCNGWYKVCLYILNLKAHHSTYSVLKMSELPKSIILLPKKRNRLSKPSRFFPPLHTPSDLVKYKLSVPSKT